MPPPGVRPHVCCCLRAPGKKGAEGQGGSEKCPDSSYFRVMVLTTKIRCLCFNELLLDEKVRDINDTTMLLD